VFVAAVTSAVALVGCQSAPPAPVTAPLQTAATASAARASADDAVNRVLAISVDGLNPRAITQLGPRGAPAFHRMMREGTWTVNARTEQELTRTLPNHTGMLTSRRIDPAHAGHGVTFNYDNGSTVHRAAGTYVPSVFDVVHDHGGRTSLYSAKTKFAFFQRTWNTNGRPDRVGQDNGKAKISNVVIDMNNARLVAKLNTELATQPRTFSFLHISLPDVAGHADGFMSPEYVAAVKQTDKLLGTVLATISRRPALRAEMLVLLTADHGGEGPSHDNAAALQNYRIPFMAWGPGVAVRRDLYAINPTFTDPGTARTGYSGKQPIRNGDLANLVTDVLDLPAVAGSELDRTRTLNLFPS